jgi:hypothetical protein
MAIDKTFSATPLNLDQEHYRYSPAAVIARAGGRAWRTCRNQPSYVERSNLPIRMATQRFTRLTNGFSKKLDNHSAAVSRYVAHYNLSVPGSRNAFPEHPQQATPAMALGLTDRPWSLGELIDAALAVAARDPPKRPRSVAASSRSFRGGVS